MVLLHLKSKMSLCLQALKAFLERYVPRSICGKQAFLLHFVNFLKTVCQHGCSVPYPTKKNCRKWMPMIAMALNLMVVNSSADSRAPGLTGVGNMATLPVKEMHVLTMMKCAISSPVSVLHPIAHNGSTLDFTGPMVSKDLLKDTGTWIL
ncbi:MAG: Uncharacterised protein [Marine Group II euryarchaeote MED-G33]|nr:MAG: Uncharacterised protein [Marine Group II euryarchaeote MED-G33]